MGYSFINILQIYIMYTQYGEGSDPPLVFIPLLGIPSPLKFFLHPPFLTKISARSIQP